MREITKTTVLGLGLIGGLVLATNNVATAQIWKFKKEDPKSGNQPSTELPTSSTKPRKSFVQTVKFEYPQNGIVMGQGFDSFSENGTVGRCVNVIEVPIETSEYTNDFREIKSTYSLFKKRATSITASGSIGGFSGSASYSTEKSHKLDLEKINLLFEFRSNIAGTKAIGIPKEGSTFEKPLSDLLVTGVKELSEDSQSTAIENLLISDLPAYAYQIELSDYAKKLITIEGGGTEKDKNKIKAEAYNKFQLVCGDGFVSAIHRGTEVKVLASYDSKSLENRRSFRATASAGGFGAKANGSKSGVDELKTFNTNTQFKIFQKGGIPIAPPKKFEDIRNTLNDSAVFIANPAGYEIEVTPYSALGVNIPSSKSPPANLERLPQYYIMLSDLYSVLDEILVEGLEPDSTKKKYPLTTVAAYGGGAHITQLRNDILQDLIFIEDTIGKCVSRQILCNASEAKENFRKLALIDAAALLGKEPPSRNDQAEVMKTMTEVNNQAHAFKSLRSIIEAKRAEIAKSDLEEATVKALNTKPDFLTSSSKFQSFSSAVVGGQSEDAYDKFFSSEPLANLYGFEEVLELTPINEVNSALDSASKISSGDQYGLGEEFFEQFYRYLVQTPLPESMISSDKIIDKKNKTDENVKSKRVTELRNTIYLERLRPWRDYFCREVFSDMMCLSDSDLWAFIEELDAENIVTQAYQTKYKDCHEFFVWPFDKNTYVTKKRGKYHRDPHPHSGSEYEKRGKRLYHCRYVYLPQ